MTKGITWSTGPPSEANFSSVESGSRVSLSPLWLLLHLFVGVSSCSIGLAQEDKVSTRITDGACSSVDRAWCDSDCMMP